MNEIFFIRITVLRLLSYGHICLSWIITHVKIEILISKFV